jgi:hypothetical protein
MNDGASIGSIENPMRRMVLAGGLAAGMASIASNANAQKPDISAGPTVAARGSQLKGKVAMVTGSARGIGRAIAVDMAANGADIVAIDIMRASIPGIRRRCDGDRRRI